MSSGKTDEMVALSHETALYHKVAPKDPISGRWSRRINRTAKPYTTDRDRSLRGKARIKARKVENKRLKGGW